MTVEIRIQATLFGVENLTWDCPRCGAERHLARSADPRVEKWDRIAINRRPYCPGPCVRIQQTTPTVRQGDLFR